MVLAYFEKGIRSSVPIFGFLMPVLFLSVIVFIFHVPDFVSFISVLTVALLLSRFLIPV